MKHEEACCLALLAMVAIGCGASHMGASGAIPLTPAASAPRPDALVVRERILRGLSETLNRGDHVAATALLEQLRALSPDVRPSPEYVSYLDATVKAYRGDFQGAAAVLYDYTKVVGPRALAAFSFHDAMIALRAADGDLIGALVECEEMTRAGNLRASSVADGSLLTSVLLKTHWHRAYLIRMLAEGKKGPGRQAFLDYAEVARRDFISLAVPLANSGDAVAVLDAYFAFLDGDRERMRAAAQRVSVEQDDDIEDLYLVQLALEGAGDAQAAAEVRRRMRTLTTPTVLTPVFLRWLRTDEEARGGTQPVFSPRYPTGILVIP
jgi:hypothetical protein